MDWYTLMRTAYPLVGITTALLLSGLGSAHAGSTNLSALPQAFHVGPFTMNVTGLSWSDPADIRRNFDPERNLVIAYSVVRTSDGASITGNDARRSIQIRGYDPVRQSRWSWGRVGNGTEATITDLDGYAAGYKLDIIVRDPNATLQQLGEAVNDVAMSGIAIDPAATGVQKIAKRYFTAFGATCTVESVTIQKVAKRGAQTQVAIAIEPSPDVADTESTLGWPLSMTDDRGRSIADRRVGVGEVTPGHWMLTFGGVPEADAHSLSLKFVINESAPSHREKGAISHEAIYIPASLIETPKATKDATSLLTAKSGTLQAYVDRYRRWPNSTAAVARLWELDDDAKSKREWRVDRIATKFGNQVETSLETVGEQHWQMNGSPAPPLQNGYNAYINLANGLRPPSQLTATATPILRTDAELTFDSVDVPGDSGVATCDARPNNNEYSQLVFRKLVTVKRNSSNAAISGIADSKRSGLAIIADYPIVKDGDVDIKLVSAIDSAGVWLLPRQQPVLDPTAMRASNIAGRREYAFLVNPPSGTADSVAVVFHIVRSTVAGPAQTVVLSGLDKVAQTK